MVKISVVGPRDQLETVSETLHKMNLVHVEDPVEEEYFKIGEPLEKASEVSKGLVQLRSFLSYLQLNPETFDPKRKYKVEELAKQVNEKLEEYSNQIGAKIDEIRSLTDKRRVLEEELAAIEPLRELGIPPKLLKGYKTIKCFVGILKADPTHRLKEITDEFEIIIKDRKKEYIAAIVVKDDYADEFFRILQEYGYREVPVPDIEDYDERIKEIENEIEQIEARKKVLE
ncbi:MAG TPA: V-type ATP synthase subunit I, partial [Archaeoglobus veneficus]|nr:V-type ATP synthase subunit I [Archaeoglobus veneficus]